MTRPEITEWEPEQAADGTPVTPDEPDPSDTPCSEVGA